MIILYIVLGIVALILVIAAIIGTKWDIERSVSIQAPVDRVWGMVNSLHQLNSWNPWMAKDPNIHLEYSGMDGKTGASFAWKSQVKNVGEGSQTIIAVDEGKALTSRVDFIKPFAGTGTAYLRIAAEGAGTRATWRMESSTPYPMNIIKIFGVIEKNMDIDFKAGLGSLKRLCEK